MRLRTWAIKAPATASYRAVFSWGERHDSALGKPVDLIGSQDGHPLDAAAGPLAVRPLPAR